VIIYFDTSVAVATRSCSLAVAFRVFVADLMSDARMKTPRAEHPRECPARREPDALCACGLICCVLAGGAGCQKPSAIEPSVSRAVPPQAADPRVPARDGRATSLPVDHVHLRPRG
jgi:hypothetical protein